MRLARGEDSPRVMSTLAQSGLFHDRDDVVGGGAPEKPVSQGGSMPPVISRQPSQWSRRGDPACDES
jgi:hypothetical protein